MNKIISSWLLLGVCVALLTSCLGLKKEELAMKEKNLIIQEVFYIGTEDEVKWPSGVTGWTSYSHDTYIRIYNPTNKVLYLDGLCLARSAFQNDVAIDLKGDENFASTHVAVDNMCMFPGSGKDYPIKPGEYKTLTSVAIDHTLDVEDLYARYKFQCALSYDNGDGTFGTNIDLGNGVKYAKQSSRKACNLEGADFEWLSPQQMLYRYQLVDENNVPNMIPLFGRFGYLDQDFLSSAPFGIPGNRSILLVKLGVAPEELDQQKYWWDYETGHPSPMHSQDFPYHKAHQKGDAHAIRVPNDWIIDAVTICDQKDFKRQRLADTVDGGYTSVRQSDNDPKSSYYGYALHRRHDGEEFVDNDNSTIDFEKQPATFLTVKPEPLLFPNITIKTKNVTLTLGDEPYQLKWEVRPRRSKNRKTSWTSENEAIATVDDKGRVTPVAVGKTKIHGSLSNGATDECIITVVEKK